MPFKRYLHIRLSAFLLFAVGLLLIHGCDSTILPSSGKLKVAVSIPPQQWLVEQIGGDKVDLLVVLPPGTTPHSYQPTDVETTRLLQCKLYFSAGVPFEQGSWFQAVNEAGTIKVIDMTEGIERLPMMAHSHGRDDDSVHDHQHHAHTHDHHAHDHHTHGHSADELDPHVWTDTERLMTMAKNTAKALAEADPENTAYYEANFKKVMEILRSTEMQIVSKLKDLKQKSFFVYHPSWGYFAHRFGLEQIAIEIEGKTPTDAEQTQLLQLARDKGVKVIFVQPQIAPDSADAVAEVIDGRVESLDPLAADVPANLLKMAQALLDAGAQ